MARVTCAFCAYCFDEALVTRELSKQGAAAVKASREREIEAHRKAMA